MRYLNLAAGTFEDLLAWKGDKYIDEIEVLAQTDPKFKKLLSNVWQNAMSEELWQRVCAVQSESW